MKLWRCTPARCTDLIRWLIPSAAALLVLSGCGELGEAMTAHTDVVARAAGKELKVEEVAGLLSSNAQIPAEPQVVRALADMWVDYTILATAVAEDSTLSALDLNAFVKPAREQALLMKLRDQVIRYDTTFTDAELAQRWTTDGPGVQVRARHILLRVPAEPTPAQRDSVRQLAETLRQRVTRGEDFAALATQFSQDPGSAQRGGELEPFGRGTMVAPFEEAAFQLQPGEVSPVVESPFGYHIIRVEGRQQQEMGGQREQFRQYLVQRAQQDAETTYLDSIAKAAQLEIRPGGLAVVREIASRPETSLRGRAAAREIATYQRGEFTTGELLEFIRTQPPEVQSMLTTATDDQIKNAVEQLTRKELLLQQAEVRKVSLSRAEEEAIRTEARQAIRQVLQTTGLAATAGRPANAATIDARVKTLFQNFFAGRGQLFPLGRLGYLLRDLYPNEINEGSFGAVVDRVEKIRASQPAPPPPAQGAQPGMVPQPTPQQPTPQQPMPQQPAPQQPAPQQPAPQQNPVQ